jgi:molybdate transport system ATP-binding protein
VILEVAIRHPLGRILLDVAFTAGDGLTALLGPSGAGKTSVLNVIAGLVQPVSGLVRVDETPLLDTTRGVFVPPHRRRIGYLCQEPRLFPHLTVAQNLRFGRWFTRGPEQRVALDDVIDLLDLRALLARRPARLSGGEKQRTALARALLMSPRLLLLDEPLASIDSGRKQDILPYLDRLRAELTMPVLYVTHVVAEITDRADTVVTLTEGRVGGITHVADPLRGVARRHT